MPNNESLKIAKLQPITFFDTFHNMFTVTARKIFALYQLQIRCVFVNVLRDLNISPSLNKMLIVFPEEIFFFTGIPEICFLLHHC
jgi:hypothetical protein